MPRGGGYALTGTIPCSATASNSQLGTKNLPNDYFRLKHPINRSWKCGNDDISVPTPSFFSRSCTELMG